MSPKTPAKTSKTTPATTATPKGAAKKGNPDLTLATRPAAKATKATGGRKYSGIRKSCIKEMYHRVGAVWIARDTYEAIQLRSVEILADIAKHIGRYSDGGIIRVAHALAACARGRGYYAGIVTN